MQSARLALPILLFGGILTTAQAQSDKTNFPFSWKETTDKWYMPKSYTFKYSPVDLSGTTPKGQAPKGQSTSKAKTGHGPVCSDECNETTSPGSCTEELLNEKLRDVKISGFTYPRGYSGVEYVTFEVQTNGKVNNYQVVKQPVLCKPCIQKAVNLVASAGDWHPAIEDGIVVKSTVVVPVYFAGNPHN